MMSKYLGFLLLTVTAAWPQSPLGSAKLNAEEGKALQFVNQAEKELLKATQEFSKIQWAYATNITDFNEQKQLEYTVSFIYILAKRRLRRLCEACRRPPPPLPKVCIAKRPQLVSLHTINGYFR